MRRPQLGRSGLGHVRAVEVEVVIQLRHLGAHPVSQGGGWLLIESHGPERKRHLSFSDRVGGGPGHRLGEQPLHGQGDDGPAAPGTVISGDEVVADEHREGEHAADLDVILVEAEGPE